MLRTLRNGLWGRPKGTMIPFFTAYFSRRLALVYFQKSVWTMEPIFICLTLNGNRQKFFTAETAQKSYNILKNDCKVILLMFGQFFLIAMQLKAIYLLQYSLKCNSFHDSLFSLIKAPDVLGHFESCDFCAKNSFKKVPPCVSIKASGEIPETFIGFMWGEGSRA